MTTKSSAGPLSILLVEDNPEDAFLACRLLTMAGEGRFSPARARDLSEAIELLRTSTFDAVLLDLSLPGCSGLESIDRLRECAPELPIVVFTGLDDEAVGTEAILRGAQDFLPKGQLTAVLLARAIQYSVERRRVEAALRASEERFRSVSQAAAEAIIVADDAGNIVSWNRGAQEIFGYEEQEVLGQPLTMLMPVRYREAHLKGLSRLRSTGVAKIVGKVVELDGLRKDGTEFPIELSIATWTNSSRMFSSGIIRDITERRRAEEQSETLIRYLQKALIEIKTLDGLLPICSGCKKIRDDSGYWNQIESYLARHTDAMFTHSYCPDCASKFLRDSGSDRPESTS